MNEAMFIVWQFSPIHNSRTWRLITLSFHYTVCVATIREFADTLTDDIKSDPKQIEEAFKEYCKTAKSKQQRLVSVPFYDEMFNVRLNLCWMCVCVLSCKRVYWIEYVSWI